MKTFQKLLLFVLLLVLCCAILPVSAQEEGETICSMSYDVNTKEESEYSIPANENAAELSEGREATDIPDAEDIEVADLNQTDGEIPSYTIFYPDERKFVYFSPDNQPYIDVTRITSDQGRCSGFMIGPHYVATAAHCLYNDETHKWNSNFTICPSYSKGNAPYGCAGADYLWVMDTGIYRPYDVGVIKLDRDLGTRTGWLGHWVISDSQTDDYAMMLGYASDLDMDYMFYMYDYLKGTTENGNLLMHKMDCLPGFSGGPMVMPYNGDWLYVVGINVSYGDTYNYSVRMTDKVMDFLDDFWGK